MVSEFELLKIAESDPEVRYALLTLAKQAGDNSNFDEKLPDQEQQDQEQQAPQQGVPGRDDVVASPIPQEEQGSQEQVQQESPEAIGARAAQEFIGPEIANAAMQGDSNAQDIISRTAGQVAGAVAESAAKIMSDEYAQGEQQEQTPQEQGQPQEQAPQEQGQPQEGGNFTNEENAASNIIPAGVTGPPTQIAPQANAGPAPAGGQQGIPSPDGGSYTPELVAKLIDLARKGMI